MKIAVFSLIALLLIAGSAAADSKYTWTIRATNTNGDNVKVMVCIMGFNRDEEGKLRLHKVVEETETPRRTTSSKYYSSMAVFVRAKEPIEITMTLVRETGGKSLPVMNVTQKTIFTYVTNDEAFAKKVIDVNLKKQRDKGK